MIQIAPANPRQGLRLESGSSLDSLLGDRVFVAAGIDPKAKLEQVHQGRTNFPLQLNHVPETLVLEAVVIELLEQRTWSPLRVRYGGRL